MPFKLHISRGIVAIMSVEDPQSSHLGNMESIICCSLSLSLLSLVIERRKNDVDMGIIYKMIMMHV